MKKFKNLFNAILVPVSILAATLLIVFAYNVSFRPSDPNMINRVNATQSNPFWCIQYWNPGASDCNVYSGSDPTAEFRSSSDTCLVCYGDPHNDDGGGGGNPVHCVQGVGDTQILNCPAGQTGTYTITRDCADNWNTTSTNCTPVTPPDCDPQTRTQSCGNGYLTGTYTQTTKNTNPPTCTTGGTWSPTESQACTPIVYCEPAHTPAPGNNINNCTPPESTPTLDLKVNGSDGPVTLNGTSPYTMTWTTNAYDCALTSPQNGPLSDQDNGTQVYPGDVWYPSQGTSLTLAMQCSNSVGSASDSVLLTTPAPQGSRIAFNSNISTNITIFSSTESQSAAGLNGAIGIRPPFAGARYGISVGDKSGYTYAITNSKGDSSGSSMYMYPAENESFNITYTPEPGPGTISVSSNKAASWTVSSNSESQGSSGAFSASYIFHPQQSGTNYAISLGSISGYTYTVTNSDGGSSDVTLSPGGSKSFDVEYTPNTCTPPTSETRHVACDTPVYSGDVTQTRQKGAAPQCTWGQWTYQSDNCVPIVYCSDGSEAPGNNVNNCAAPNTTATVRVLSNVPAAWTISPYNNSQGYLDGSDQNFHSVDVGSGGEMVYVTPGVYSDYDYPPTVTNNITGTGDSVFLSPGDSVTFTVTYTQGAEEDGPFTYDLSNSGLTTLDRDSGPSVQSVITETLTGGTAETVTLLPSGMPDGVTASVSPTSGCTPNCSSTILFTAFSDVADGDYPITVTGTPGNVRTSFTLRVTGSPMNVSCVPSPAVAKVGDSVTWTASVNGGTPPYHYEWSGTSIPVPAPSTNPYTVTYSTVGIKNTTVTVTDSAAPSQSVASCDNSTVQVNLNPKLEEF